MQWLSDPNVLIATAVGGAVFFMLAGWLAGSLLARRQRRRSDRIWDDKVRSERGDGERARRQVLQLNDELRTAQDTLRASQETGTRLGVELAAQIRTAEDLRSQRDFLSVDFDRATSTIATLGRQIDTLIPLEASVADLEHQCAELHSETAARDHELAGLRTTLEQERHRLSIRVETLEEQVRQAADAAKQEFDRRTRQLETWQAERARFRNDLTDAETRQRDVLAVLHQMTADRDEARRHLEQLETWLADRDKNSRDVLVAHQAALAEKDAELGSVRALSERVEPLRLQLEDREQVIRAVAAERDAALAEVRTREAEMELETGRLRAKIAEQRAALEEAQARLARGRDLEIKLGAAGRERDQLGATVQRFAAEMDTYKAEAKDREQRFRVLSDEFRSMNLAKDQEIIGLRAHVEGLEAQLQERAPVQGNGHPPRRRPSVVPVGAKRSAAEPKDDLKLIRGIGPALERMLNDQGIYLYRQIAEWTPDDIARIGERLHAFPDRITRDDWIGSARREHERKYGALP